MKGNDQRLVWIVAGVLGSMALAIALIPVRAIVSASNLAFAFVAFTIVVAELGGRGPALVTAVVAAMSLNFFLTEPYLTLAISKPDDIVAFFALAACGLIAAAFGRRRERLSKVADRADRELTVLSRFAERARAGRSLQSLLQDLRADFGLSALVLRESGGTVLAAEPEAAASRPAPQMALSAQTLFAADEVTVRFGAKGMRLPDGGGRLTLQSRRGPLTLDVWEGNTEGFGQDESRTLAIAASILGLGMR